MGCCQGLSELKILLKGPNNIYFDFKKVLRDAIKHYSSPKSGEINLVFGSDRSPRCQDVRVCVCVCLCDIMLKGTVKEFWRVKMSSSSILKHPGEV